MRCTKMKVSVACVAVALIVSPLFALAGETKKIVHLEIKGPILEVPQSNPFMFGMSKRLTTRTLMERLKKMRNDPEVAAVYVTFENPAMGFAQLQEFRRALQQLKMVDKEVYIHFDSVYSTPLYWLASVASKIAVVPTGDVWLTGFYAEQLYLKDMLTHLRLEADVIHIGAYKSAGETVTRNEPSEAAAEMTNWLVDDLYSQMVKEMAEGRSMKVKQIESVIDNGPYSAETAKTAGLIDEVAYRKDFVELIKERHGDLPFDKKYGKDSGPDLDFDNPFAAFQEIFSTMFQPPDEEEAQPSIALIYVAGVITPGEGDDSPFAQESHGSSSRLRKALYRAAYDDNIKAVVLRVDSPGGSAVASEIIWNATQAVAKEKPFIVSMGNVAASGGYYVSCGAETIFAEPGTITGSIGVVAVKFVTKPMWEWMGIHWHPIKRGANADIMASDKKFSEAHRAKIEGWMNDIYGVFKGRILAKRKDRLTKPLESIAGGRVYTGKQALELGLVDKLGGLQDALKHAALEAKLGEDYRIRVLPRPKSIFDIFTEGFDVRAAVAARSSLTGSPLYEAALPVLQTLEPLKAQAFLRMLQQVELMQKENILLVMPSEIVIH